MFFYLVDTTVPSTEIRLTTIQAPRSTTKKLSEENPSVLRALRLLPGAGRKPLFIPASKPASGAVVKVSLLVSWTRHRFPLVSLWPGV